MSIEGSLSGDVAIITGAGRGLGAAASELFARAGADVVLVARTGSEIEALAERLRNEGMSAHAIQADVSKIDDCRRVIDETIARFRQLDIVVNNAAVAHPYQRVEEVDPVAWAEAVNINLLGSFYMSRFALDHFSPMWGGRIINVSSGLAFRARVGQSAYCVSKAGLEMFRKTLALELEGTPYAVASYDPGMIDTPMQEGQRALDAAALRVDTDVFHTAHREGRLRDPMYVAHGLLWLATRSVSIPINGQRYSIDDGEFRDQLENYLNEFPNPAKP